MTDKQITEQDTLIEEPWTHQFEKDEQGATRSARLHPNDQSATLYTKIIFGVFIFTLIVVVGWIVLKAIGVLGGNNVNKNTPSGVPKLVLQSSAASMSSFTVPTADTTTSNKESSESSKEKTSEKRESGKVYVVLPGESPAVIASKNGLTLERFNQLNGFGDKTMLHPGDKVYVSDGATQETRASNNAEEGTYTIKAGDSISLIASKHNMSIGEFTQLNGLKSNSTIHPGQKVKVYTNR